jgi:acyl transferase domain-containing protein
MEPLREAAAEAEYCPPQTLWISTLTAQPVFALDADYWVKSTAGPVNFQKALDYALAEGCTAFVELGPKPQLLASAIECRGENSSLWLPSLRPDTDARAVFFESKGELERHKV